MDAILTAVREEGGQRRGVTDRVRSVGGGENEGRGKEKKGKGDGLKDNRQCSAKKKGSKGQEVRGDTFIEIRGRVRR